jgi:hypothetical protein
MASRPLCSARNKNLEVPVYFLKEKQGYTVRKMERKINGLMYIDKCCYEIQEKKFGYSIPAYAGQFRALSLCQQTSNTIFVPIFQLICDSCTALLCLIHIFCRIIVSFMLQLISFNFN